MCRTQMSIQRLAVILVVVLSFVSPGAAPATDQTPSVLNSPTDYAALLPGPADLESIGLNRPGMHHSGFYGVDYSQTFTEVGDAMRADPYAWSRGAITLPASPSVGTESMLRDAGWLRLHEQLMGAPHEGFPDTLAVAIATGVEEYADTEGAAAAYRALSNPDVLASMTESSSIAPVETTRPFGSASGMWRVETERWTGATSTVLTLWVQSDRFIAGVTMFDFTLENEPDPGALEQLMRLLLMRLDAPGTKYAPGLSLCALRLGGPGVTPGSDRYETLNGIVVPLFGDTPESLVQRQAENDEQGIVDRYAVFQDIVSSPLAAPESQAYFNGWSIDFEDETAAETFQRETEQRFSGFTVVEDFQMLPDPPDMGSSAIGYTYKLDDTYVTTLSIRSGDLVTAVRIGGTREPVPDVTESLMAVQLERLEQSSCMESVPVPDQLLGRVPYVQYDLRQR